MASSGPMQAVNFTIWDTDRRAETGGHRQEYTDKRKRTRLRRQEGTDRLVDSGTDAGTGTLAITQGHKSLASGLTWH